MPAALVNSLKADEEDRRSDHAPLVAVTDNEEVVTLTTTIETNLRHRQTCVGPTELWLRDDLEEVYALLFRFLGYGFRLAMSKVGWLVTQKFVILVPDPNGFAPWSVLFGRGEPCVTAVKTRHTLWCCVFFCAISYHKSIGGQSSSRWRAGRATSSRRRGTGRSRRVAAASRRSGRSARRAGSREACFVYVVAHVVVSCFSCPVNCHKSSGRATLVMRWTACSWNGDVACNAFPKLLNVAGVLIMSTLLSCVPRVSNDSFHLVLA